MGSISSHIMPLVINTLRGGDTHTQTHTHKHTQTHTQTHTYRCPHRNNFKKPGVHRPVAGTLGLKFPGVQKGVAKY